MKVKESVKVSIVQTMKPLYLFERILMISGRINNLLFLWTGLLSLLPWVPEGYSPENIILQCCTCNLHTRKLPQMLDFIISGS